MGEPWPEYLTPEHSAIHTAIENAMKEALNHCYQSADSALMDWTYEGWISVSAGNVMAMLQRAGNPSPRVLGGDYRLPMPTDPHQPDEEEIAELEAQEHRDWVAEHPAETVALLAEAEGLNLNHPVWPVYRVSLPTEEAGHGD